MPRSLELHFTNNVGPVFFRVLWWNSLDPRKRTNFKDELLEALTVGLLGAYKEHSGIEIPASALGIAKQLLLKMIETRVESYSALIPDFTDMTYDNYIKKILDSRGESELMRLLADQHDIFCGRIACLAPDLISAVNIINEEFIIWLQTHQSSTETIHADAFEQLVGEILASQGFEIHFTGRIKNQSSDIIAIQKVQQGGDVKYLVECKRYKASRRVDLNILNAVIGASFRSKIDHAMLVTTSSFTRNVHDAQSQLRNFRLDLCDGQKIVEWLEGYRFKKFGLWLEEGWQDQWRPE